MKYLFTRLHFRSSGGGSYIDRVVVEQRAGGKHGQPGPSLCVAVETLNTETVESIIATTTILKINLLIVVPPLDACTPAPFMRRDSRRLERLILQRDGSAQKYLGQDATFSEA